MDDINKIRLDLKKAFKANQEKIMKGIIKREYPTVTGVTVNYNLIRDDFDITGLTPEQEDHVRKQPK